MLENWLKVFHLYAVIVALGSAAARLLLAWHYRRGTNLQQTQMSEEFTLFMSRRLEMPALTLAVILGLSIAIVHGGYWKQGWLHAKIAIAIILLGLSHMGAAALRRLGKLRAASGAEDQITAMRSRLLVFGIAMALLTIIIIYLVTVKPF